MSLLIPPFGGERGSEGGEGLTGWDEDGGNLVKAAHKGIHKEKERRDGREDATIHAAPKHTSREGKRVPSPDEKGIFCKATCFIPTTPFNPTIGHSALGNVNHVL